MSSKFVLCIYTNYCTMVVKQKIFYFIWFVLKDEIEKEWKREKEWGGREKNE